MSKISRPVYLLGILSVGFAVSCGSDNVGNPGGGQSGPTGPFVLVPGYVQIVDASEAPILDAFVWLTETSGDLDGELPSEPIDFPFTSCDESTLAMAELQDATDSGSALACTNIDGIAGVGLLDPNCGPDNKINIRIHQAGLTAEILGVNCTALAEAAKEEPLMFTVTLE